MRKKIIWSSDALEQLEDILFESKSIHIADKVVEKIFESTTILLKPKPEIYKLDSKKNNNDGNFRVYFVYDYFVPNYP